MADATNTQNLTARKPLTAERLRELLRYDPATGVFTWLCKRGENDVSGKMAGVLNNERRRVIRVDYRMYYAHRLAWLYMTGEWPADKVDHRDGDPSNNRWSNLRAATGPQNGWNMRRNVRNTSGVKGVTYVKRWRNWRAMVTANGRARLVGDFKSKSAAEAAIRVARENLHGEFARHE